MASTPRLTTNERRAGRILDRLPLVREQLLVAMDEFGEDLGLEAFVGAAQSEDAAERNKVAVVERELDVIVNLLEELGSRMLAEGQRRGSVEKGTGGTWERLAAAKVIPKSMAHRLREAKDTRNDLDHSYPPTSWKIVHAATVTVMGELDRYVVRVTDWAEEIGMRLR